MTTEENRLRLELDIAKSDSDALLAEVRRLQARVKELEDGIRKHRKMLAMVTKEDRVLWKLVEAKP